jgi:alpha-L-rhamnosidase
MFKSLIIVLLAASAWVPASQAAGAKDLRCEYLKDPLGLHETQPRLSWIVTADRRAERQTAYRILVASTLDKLAKNEGDLWDSGQVDSDETAQIAYAGKSLASRQTCFWKVQVWDRDNRAGAWSKPARWEMGLLNPSDWSAKWITTETAVKPTAAQPKIVHAVYEAVDGAGSLDVTTLMAEQLKTSSAPITVNNTSFGKDPAYNHVKRLVIDYELNGKPLHREIQEGQAFSLSDEPVALKYLRKSFAVKGPVRHATLYATALGLYELRLNGQRVGDYVLAPEWTDYRKRSRYQAYDVTSLLKRGDNALGGLVANGWYSGHIGNGGNQFYGKVPALFAQLEISYADGHAERVVTDTSWKTHASPILSSDFMLGESYDARRELSGWDRPGLNESQWQAAAMREEAPRPLEGQVMEPVRQYAELKPKAITEPKPGRWTFDMGQNMVGVARLKVSAPAGTKITLRHAEVLNPDGTIYTVNLRSAISVDTYICKGTGAEIWQPQFTFHGFRYVELSGLASKPGLDAVTGIVITSDTSKAGDFACSDSRINQLQSNIQWGQRGNYISIPTDCPQRDERLGWMGDAQVFIRTATGNADVAAFFTKWLVDVDDGQSPEGSFSDVNPNTMNCGSVPAWGDAGVICPWTIYHVYGDKRILEKHLPAMTRWVEWCRNHSTGLIRDKDRGNDYGDWLSIGADTPKDLIGTAYFAYSTRLVAKSYQAIGDLASAAKYEQLFQDIKTAFIKKYVAADGRIHGNTQCCYVMALKFDLLPEEMRAKAAQYLEEDIKGKGWHLSTGFVGVSYLLPVLTQADKLDVAYRLLLQDTFPSWLFSVKHGATTIWERWDGWTPDKGFQDPGMNSFNHYSLGSCGEWLYGSVAGINTDPGQPGFRRVVIHPRVGGGLTWAKGAYNSIRGPIASSWALKNGKTTLDVTIPANTIATVYVPAKNAKRVTESGKPADTVKEIQFLRQEEDAVVYAVPSGEYHFAVSEP